MGLHAHETKFVNDIPCDYKGKGNLVDPDPRVLGG